MLSKSLKWKINTKDIQNFAMIVGDHNPVHRDPAFAAKTRFKTPIAHGMVSITLLNQLLPSIFNIKSLNIRFMKPIYPEYDLTASLKIEKNDQFVFQVSKETQLITTIKGHLQKVE